MICTGNERTQAEGRTKEGCFRPVLGKNLEDANMKIRNKEKQIAG
jgi:hypothetical protein